MQEALQARKALQESEERYRVLVENSPDLITRFDRERRLVFANPATLLRTGRPAEMLLGRTPQEYGAAQSSTSTWEQYFRRVLETGKTQAFDNTSIWQGQARTYDTLAVPEFGADGTVASVMMIARDITEKRQAEETLRKNEADLRAILDATKESIWMFDPEGSILLANETALKRINRSAEEMIDQPFSKFVPAELAQTRQACLQKVVESGQPVELEDERGGIIFHHIFYPVKNSTGQVVRIAAFSQDITKRKQAEDALRQSEERFKAIASNTPDHILVQDRDLRYTFVVNPQLGLTEQDMLGKTDQDFLTKEDAENLTQIKRHVLETGKPTHLEVPLLSAAGEAQFFDGTYVPKYDAEGQIDGLIGYFKNITELKRIEAALRLSEERYRNLFNTMDEGFCIVEMIFDARQQPVDYRFLEVNPAFEKQTGLHEAQGKLMRTLAPEPETYWFESYGKVALSGEPAHFINEARQLKRWYEVYAYRIGKAEERRVAIIFNDISDRKQAEEKLQASNEELKRFNKAMVGRELRMVELKNEINELCRRAGLPERYSKDDGAQTIDNRGTL
jgi:PAS domain S-box-containing protein